MRQKNLSNLFKVDSKLNEITKVWSKKPSSESNIFTCCYISNDSRSIILSDCKCFVNIYDIETDKKKWKATKRSFVSKTPVVDKWNQVNMLENLIYFANRNYFYAADIRVNFLLNFISFYKKKKAEDKILLILLILGACE